MTQYTKEQVLENRAKLVAALRSGEFTQATGQLATAEGHCCLGVACEVAIREGVIDHYPSINLFAPYPVEQWLGFHGEGLTAVMIDGEVSHRIGLAGLNDDYEFTFDEIADVIEDGLLLWSPEYES